MSNTSPRVGQSEAARVVFNLHGALAKRHRDDVWSEEESRLETRHNCFRDVSITEAEGNDLCFADNVTVFQEAD